METRYETKTAFGSLNNFPQTQEGIFPISFSFFFYCMKYDVFYGILQMFQSPILNLMSKENDKENEKNHLSMREILVKNSKAVFVFILA